MYTQEDLIALLKEQSKKSTAAECCAALLCGNSFFRSPLRPLPVRQVLDSYELRAETNRMKQIPIQGFDTLLPALAACPKGVINIYSVATEAKWFLVFTNAATTRLIGILSEDSGSLFQYYERIKSEPHLPQPNRTDV